MNDHLRTASERFSHWVQYDALPLWMKQGIEPHTRAHYERLTHLGDADTGCDVRVRVQARQMFVYSFAHFKGWCEDAFPLVDGIWKFVDQVTAHPSARDGYTHLMNHRFQVIDSKQDLYDHAFFLLAYTWIYKAFGKRSALQRVYELVAYLDDRWGSPIGGWQEGDYEADIRRQNPHMHLFEAFLNLYSVTGDAAWIARASELFGLFQTRFYDPDTHTLREYFTLDWQPLAGPQGNIVEPGHMFEWVWLLRWYERLSGRPVGRYADAMYNKALAIGVSHPTELIFDETDADGQVLKSSKRCWPITELIKANIAQARAGHCEAEEHAAQAIDKLFEFFLCAQRPGAYVDQLGEDDKVLVGVAPASTLYHLVVAAAEVDDYVNDYVNGYGNKRALRRYQACASAS